MKICGSELFIYSQILLVLKINLVVYVHCLSNYDGRHGQCKQCYHHFLFTFLFFNPLNVILVNLLPFDGAKVETIFGSAMDNDPF